MKPQPFSKTFLSWQMNQLYFENKKSLKMKINKLLIFSLVLASMAFQSCLKDDCDRTVSYIYVEPIYKTLDEIHAGGVVNEAPRPLLEPGQFYYYNDHIFINERGEGIHVIDNSDPTAPINTAFLAIEGNEDLAIKNGYLYANTYIDLLVIDLNTFEVAGRTENAFEPQWQQVVDERVLVDWKEIPKTEVVDCETYNSFSRRGGIFYDFGEANGAFLDEATFNATSSTSSTSGTGIGGSMARFTIMSDYLYAIEESGMELFDLSNPISPDNIGFVDIGWGIETIFPYEDKLFIGSNSGMFIYDNSVPSQPSLLAEFAHARACDPVFVKDNHAYVTLRSGTLCDGFINQLDLIDITTLTNPQLLKTFPMDNPHGLSIKEDKLFLCEGEFGVKSFDISDPMKLDENRLDHKKGLHAFDAISLPGNDDIIMIIGQDGFYQYKYDEEGNMDEISKIEIVRK